VTKKDIEEAIAIINRYGKSRSSFKHANKIKNSIVNSLKITHNVFIKKERSTRSEGICLQNRGGIPSWIFCV